MLTVVLVATATAWWWDHPERSCQEELKLRCGEPRLIGRLGCTTCTDQLYKKLAEYCYRTEMIDFCRSACAYRSHCCEGGACGCPLPGYAPPDCTSCLPGYGGSKCDRCTIGYVGWPRCHRNHCDINLHCSGNALSASSISHFGDAFCFCRCRSHWTGCDCRECPAGVDPLQDCAVCQDGYRGTAPACTPEPAAAAAAAVTASAEDKRDTDAPAAAEHKRDADAPAAAEEKQDADAPAAAVVTGGSQPPLGVQRSVFEQQVLRRRLIGQASVVLLKMRHLATLQMAIDTLQTKFARQRQSGCGAQGRCAEWLLTARGAAPRDPSDAMTLQRPSDGKTEGQGEPQSDC